ncbi:phage terminase large subunit [Priestia megaterium]
MTFSFNPVSANHWIKRKYFDIEHQDIYTYSSTYLENRFIDEAYHRRMMLRKEQDPEGYKIYGLGNGESLVVLSYPITLFMTLILLLNDLILCIMPKTLVLTMQMHYSRFLLKTVSFLYAMKSTYTKWIQTKLLNLLIKTSRQKLTDVL